MIKYSIGIDKVNVCFAPSFAIQTFIRQQIEKIDPQNPNPFAKVSFSKKTGYEFTGVSHVPSIYSGQTEVLVLQAIPTKSSYPKMFLRLDLNPSKVSAYGWMLIENLLRSLKLDLGQVLNQGRFTRVDVALDFADLTLEQILIRSSGAKKHTVVAGGKGVLETQYCGDSRKSGSVIAYTKAFGKGDEAVLKLRLERRVKCRMVGLDLLDMANPFTKIEMVKIDALANLIRQILPGAIPMHVFDSMRARGRRAALKPLTRKQRVRIEAFFRDPANSLSPDFTDNWEEIWFAALVGSGLGSLPWIASRSFGCELNAKSRTEHGEDAVSYEILGNNGRDWSCNQGGWFSYLKVATAFGWAPDGAFFKDDEAGFGPYPTGSYMGNGRQLVTDEDARAFGAALRLAITTADLGLPMTPDQKDALADFRGQRTCELSWEADFHKRGAADSYDLSAMRALADVVSDGGFMIA